MLYPELSESIQRGNAAFCIGAELTIEAGLPSWVSLLRPLAKTLGVHLPSNDADLTVDRLTSVAQHYENKMGRNALISHLRKLLDTTSMKPTPIHRLLALSPAQVMFTTNYDVLLEQAFREAGRRVNVIISEADLAFWQHDEIQLIKLCGDISRPESIVITQRDFNTFLATHSRLAEHLRNILESNTVLFLGYSMQDPFFNQIWDSIGLQFGALRRQGFAVMFDAEPLVIDDLRYRGIQVVNLETVARDKSLVLEQWLFALLRPHLVSERSGAKGDVDDIELGNRTYGTGRKWAVLVGVNEYEDSVHYGPLHVCVSDAKAIQEKLIAGGFERQATFPLTGTEESESPSRENILATLKSVAEATDEDDLLLFYYSGHGDVQDEESYLVSQNGRAFSLEDTAVPLTRVKDILEKARARAKVIIVDACHSGANIWGKGPKRMSREFIRHVFEQAEGLAILASCQYQQLSYEWQDQMCSVFTYFLLEALDGHADQDKKGFVTVQDANRYIVHGVKLWAAQHKVVQTPTLQYEVSGDIILGTHTH